MHARRGDQRVEQHEADQRDPDQRQEQPHADADRDDRRDPPPRRPHERARRSRTARSRDARSALPPHQVAEHDHRGDAERGHREEQLVREPEHGSLVRVDPPARELRGQRVVGEVGAAHDLERAAVDGNLVDLGREAALDLAHGPRRARVLRRRDLHEARVDVDAARDAEDVVEGRGIHGGRRRGRGGRMVADVRIRRRGRAGTRARERGRERRRLPAERGAQVGHVLPAELRPRDARGRQEQRARDEPHARRRVPGQDPPVAGGLRVRPHEVALPRGPTPARDPQAEAREGHDAEPARGELAVEAAGVAEAERAVEVADRGAQRQGAARAVDGQVAADGRVRRIHEDRPGLARDEAVAREHDARRVAGRGGRADGDEGAGSADHGLRGLDLLGERDGGSGRGRVQLVGVDDLLGRRREGVGRAAQGRGEDERAHEDPREEVQAQQQRDEPAALRAGDRGGRGRGIRRDGRIGGPGGPAAAARSSTAVIDGRPAAGGACRW